MRYIVLFFIVNVVFSQEKPKPELTEVWEPEPVIVTPGKNNQPPSDAIVLFDGKDLSQWVNARGGDASWILNNDRSGSMTVTRNGGIETKEEFGSVQFHIEWKTPAKMEGKGQGRGNSGVIFQRRFEVQILDSYNNRTYSNGQAASIYKQHAPLVNSSRPPGEWQSYDIIFIEPEFNEVGTTIKRGSFTVFHNGVLVQNNVQILGTTEYIGMPLIGEKQISTYMPGNNSRKTIYIQDHGNPVSFRNIWLRKL
ncbi:MAG: DUF1080 domain-containing protein [Flavobacteriaceae bacterium]|nr:DUF1080 domain-containing protein [Flavobacteriaceae bacterium]